MAEFNGIIRFARAFRTRAEAQGFINSAPVADTPLVLIEFGTGASFAVATSRDILEMRRVALRETHRSDIVAELDDPRYGV